MATSPSIQHAAPPRPRQRFGLPQVLAALLLLVFLAQGAWLLVRLPVNTEEAGFITLQNNGRAATSSTLSDPLPYSMLTARMARWLWWRAASLTADQQSAAARFPFLIFGTLLGASVWYVARRLYANAGGYIALALYVFSPVMLTRVARVQPDIAVAWAIFGCIFTGIAVAHTLYAPREVVLWNWRRILLLGLAIGLGAAAQLPTLLAIPGALAFMLWIVPERRGAALAIMGAACLVGLAIVLAIYGFNLSLLGQAVARSGLFGMPRLLGLTATVRMIALFFLRNGPGFVLLFVVAVVAYAVWPRARFFGNTAPLLVTSFLIGAVVVLPHAAGFPFLVAALPFTFVFIAGIFADLLETRQASLVLGMVLAVLATDAFFSISGLLQLRR